MADEVQSEAAQARRNFLKTAVAAGVAGAAVLATGGEAQAEPPRRTKGNAVPSPTRVSAAEAAKESKRAEAERLLRELDGDVQVEWVKGAVPGARRVIQLKG